MKYVNRMPSPTSCPEGYTLRKGHTRKPRGKHTIRRDGKVFIVSSSNVPVRISASCVKTRKHKETMSKTSKQIRILRKGALIKYGYQWRLSDITRRNALKKAVKDYGALSVFHKLDAVTKLTKRKAPNAHVRLEMDRDWIRAMYLQHK